MHRGDSGAAIESVCPSCSVEGPVFVDEGSIFSMKHNVLACPTVLKMVNGAYKTVKLDDLATPAGR